MKPIRRLICLSTGCLLLAVTTAAFAQQSYPTRPVRIVIGWATGGSADLTGRLLSQRLGERLGQQFIVDNRPGASGAIGADAVARAVPDGYTLLYADVSSLVINPQIEKVNFDVARDFTPVSPLAFGYYVLVIHPSLPARSVKELIALAKARPGEINYASGGSGSNLSLVAELFKITAGINITHIPYKGGGPAGVSVLAGETQMMFSGIASVLPLVQSNRLVALALTSPKRSALMPQVPTFAESGLQGLDVGLWFALLAPAATPRDVIARLNSEIGNLSTTPEYRAQLEKQGYEPFTSSPEQFSTFVKAELDKWGKLIKAAGIK